MISRTHIRTVAERPPDSLNSEFRERRIRLHRVGTSLYGWIYRSDEESVWYRLLPRQQADLERRQAIQLMIESSFPPSIARVIGTDWDAREGVLLVRYDVPPGGRSFVEILEDPDPGVRLEHGEHLLRTITEWWDRLGAPLLPTPADVVIVGDQAILLALPAGAPPSLESIMCDPSRTTFLAPEILEAPAGFNTDEPRTARNLDRFAIGVSLLRSLFEHLEVTDLDHRLRRSAVGAAHDLTDHQSRLPFWMTRVPASQEVQEIFLRLVEKAPDVRGTADPTALATQLAACRDRLTPMRAIEEVRMRSTAEAYELLQAVLVNVTDDDLFILGGELANNLGRPLEAIDYYEKAIIANSDRVDPYEAQLRILCSARSPNSGPLSEVLTTTEAGAQLDTKLLRNYDRLSNPRRQAVETDVAQYLIWRAEQRSDTELLGRAFEILSDHVKHSEDPDANLAYAEAFAVAARLASGASRRQNIDSAKRQLFRVRSIVDTRFSGKDPITRNHYNKWINRIEEALGGAQQPREYDG